MSATRTLKITAVTVGLCCLMGASAHVGVHLAEQGHEKNVAQAAQATSQTTQPQTTQAQATQTSEPVPPPTTVTSQVSTSTNTDETKIIHRNNNSGNSDRSDIYRARDILNNLHEGDIDPVTGAEWGEMAVQHGFLTYLGGTVNFGQLQHTPHYQGNAKQQYVYVLETPEFIMNRYRGIKPQEDLNKCRVAKYGYLVCTLEDGDVVVMDMSGRNPYAVGSKTHRFTKGELKEFKDNWNAPYAEMGEGVGDYKGWHFICKGYPRDLGIQG